MGKKLEIKAGDEFGGWTVLEEAEPYVAPCGAKQRRFKRRCECGVEREIPVGRRSGNHSKRCGCLSKEVFANNMRKAQKIRASQASHIKEIYPELYRVLNMAIQRCTNPNDPDYKNYGGRGICVCDEWRNDRKKFVEFAIAKGWKKGLQMDRENNDGNYDPSNVRFVEPKANVRNRRTTIRNADGVPLVEVYEKAGDKCVTYEIFATRVRRGWAIEKALTTPALKRRSSTNGRQNAL